VSTFSVPAERPPAAPPGQQRVSRLDFHARKRDDYPFLGDYQFARPRLEQIKAPTRAELVMWAAYAAASIFCTRRDGTQNDGFNPAGLSTLTTAKRIPGGSIIITPEQREEMEKEARENEDARVCCLVVWDKPDGTVGVDVVGTAEGWESTQAGRIANAVADLCRAG